MGIHEVDSRTSDADREFSYWVQRGVDPAVVAALLPMLVGPGHTARAAERFLSTKGMIGYDLSPEGMATARSLRFEAQRFFQSALERGDFAGQGQPVFSPGDRYLPSEQSIHDEMDERFPNPGYPSSRENAWRLAASAAEDEMRAKHPNARGFMIEDDGSGTGWANVMATDPNTLKRHVIDRVRLPRIGPAPLDVQDDSARSRYESADLSNEYEHHRAEMEWGHPEGVDRPFFLDP